MRGSSSDNVRHVLATLDSDAWFKALPEFLKTEITSRSVIRAYRRHAVIWAQESTPQAMCVVLEGRVRLARLLSNGEEGLFHIGEPGFSFGQLTLLSNERTAVAAIADTDVRLMMLTKAQSDCIGIEYPVYYQHLGTLVARRYAALLRTVTYAKLPAPEERVRARLFEMIAVQRSGALTSTPAVLNVSQVDLAAIAGVSRQTLNELLKKLKDEGLIEVTFRQIRVLDPTRLWQETIVAIDQ